MAIVNSYAMFVYQAGYPIYIYTIFPVISPNGLSPMVGVSRKQLDPRNMACANGLEYIYISNIIICKYPDAPWCWYIYLHDWVIFMAYVGKYSSTMEHMGYIYIYTCMAH